MSAFVALLNLEKKSSLKNNFKERKTKLNKIKQDKTKWVEMKRTVYCV